MNASSFLRAASRPCVLARIVSLDQPGPLRLNGGAPAVERLPARGSRRHLLPLSQEGASGSGRSCASFITGFPDSSASSTTNPRITRSTPQSPASICGLASCAVDERAVVPARDLRKPGALRLSHPQRCPTIASCKLPARSRQGMAARLRPSDSTTRATFPRPRASRRSKRRSSATRVVLRDAPARSLFRQQQPQLLHFLLGREQVALGDRPAARVSTGALALACARGHSGSSSRVTALR